MALTKAQVKEILSAAGVDSEHLSDSVEKIVSGHVASIEALRDEVSTLKEENARYKQDAEKLPKVQEELKELKEAAGKSGDYAKLKQEFEDYKAQVAADKAKAEKQAAYTEILKDAGITSEKAIAKVLKYTNFDNIELDAEGKIKDAKEQMKAVKEEWSELVSKTQTTGAKVENPPGGTQGSAFANMSLSEKMQYANEHPGDESVKAWLESDLTVKQNPNNDKE